MMDEELQERIERGDRVVSPDAAAYQAVFNALRREPGFILPPSFADDVMARLHKPAASRDFIWLFLGLTCFLIALAVAIALTEFRPRMGVFTFLSGYAGLIGFAIVFITLLHWIDRRFIRKFTPGAI